MKMELFLLSQHNKFIKIPRDARVKMNNEMIEIGSIYSDKKSRIKNFDSGFNK